VSLTPGGSDGIKFEFVEWLTIHQLVSKPDFLFPAK